MNETIINSIDVREEHKICKYRFKGKSCKDCPLNCKFKRLQEENKELKNRLKTLDDEEFVYEVTEIEYNNFKKMNKYKQALEEIRKEANRLLYEENPIYGYNNSNYFELLAKYVLAKTKEVLNENS